MMSVFVNIVIHPAADVAGRRTPPPPPQSPAPLATPPWPGSSALGGSWRSAAMAAAPAFGRRVFRRAVVQHAARSSELEPEPEPELGRVTVPVRLPSPPQALELLLRVRGGLDSGSMLKRSYNVSIDGVD